MTIDSGDTAQQSGHRHAWRLLVSGRRSGGSADDEEVDGEYMICQKCGEVRLASQTAIAAEDKRYVQER